MLFCTRYLERFPSSIQPSCGRFFARRPLFLTNIAHHTRKLGMPPLFARDGHMFTRNFSCSYMSTRKCRQFEFIWFKKSYYTLTIIFWQEQKIHMLNVDALLRRIWENILSKENPRGRGLHWKFCFWCKFCFSWRQNIHALYASANAERAHYSTLSVYKVRRMRNIERDNLFISMGP